MGTVPVGLARNLKRRLGLERAVETGTWAGGGALLLSDVFRDVTTIELSEEIATRAAEVLAREPIEVVQGDSRDILRPSTTPTFYFLDGHYMGGTVAAEDQCPVLDELAAIAGGHDDDCIVIDDARFFVAPPPPPSPPEKWPTLAEIEERLKLHWPRHSMVVAHDQIVVVPERAADLAGRFAAAPFQQPRRERNLFRRGLRKARRLIREAREG
jgi:hypothetical protein